MAYTNIDDPSAYFQVATYTGTGSTQSITNDGNSNLKPDWVWVKSRSNGGTNNVVFDSSRGVNNRLITNLTIAEDTGDGYGVVSAFNTDGFTVNPQTNLINVGGDGYTYVAWQWKANGGTTSTNTDGSINTTVQSNSTAGFNIITYTGTGGGETLGHGLGVAPDMWIVKRRSGTGSWAVGFNDSSILGGTSNYLILQSAAATSTYNNFWGSSPANSNVMRIAGDSTIGGSGSTYVAYVFAQKQGYSKFGSYVGNGVANNGPFVYLGFKPAFVMIKSTAATGAHYLWDTKRNPFNGADDTLNAAEADAETSNGIMTVDILSNGLK